MHDALGHRIKENYEHAYRIFLPRRMPVIIRVDGKAFHTLTKECQKPFDRDFVFHMDEAAKALMKEVQGAQIAYIQSDEISILVHNYKRFTSEAWFDNNLQKMVSVSASLATEAFNKGREWKHLAVFDSRVFVLPEAEVANYFVWRQQDAVRNSIQGLAQSLYSQKELLGKNVNEQQEMIFQKGFNWDNLETQFKRGRCVLPSGEIDYEIPTFSKNREYIEQYLEVIDK